MVRRKKSLLFSVSLASAGLVAGALFAAAPKTQASGEELNATTPDAKIQAISEKINLPTKTINDSLKTHKLILGIKDKKELDENEDIVDYNKVAEGVYVVTFKDFDATAENYTYYKDSERATGVSLNLPMEVKERIEPTNFHPISISGTYNIPEVDKCVDTAKDDYTYNNFTKWPDQCLAWGVDAMNILDYAKSITSASNVKVAVIDSGISAHHVAFTYENAGDRLDMTMAYDYVGKDTNPDDGQNDSVTDDEGNSHMVTHGTSVAGTIAESTGFNVKIVPNRVTSGRSVDMSLVLEAVSALKGKVDVINLSLGSTNKINKTDQGYDELDQVMKEAKNAGTIVVAASGNGGQNYISWPAMSDYTIAVGATNENKQKSDFSQYSSEVDFAAPGEALLLPAGGSEPSSFTLTSGTSFATPFVSAAVANILSEHPNYGFNDVYNTLKLNSEDLGDAGKDDYFGWGNISFHVNRLADIQIANATASTSAWASEASASATASSNAYNITHYTLQSGDTSMTRPSSWTDVETPGKNVSISKAVSSNGTYTLWVKNSNNEIKAKTLTISGIDKTAPTISTGFKVSNITDTGATLSVGVKDTESGLAKIVWHYKLEDAENYTDETETYATTGTDETVATTKTFTLSNLETGKKYIAYATVYDVAGNSKDSATATFEVTAGTADVDTNGDDEPTTLTNPTAPTNPTDDGKNKPKPVNTNGSNVSNPKTADINLAGIAGVGVLLSTTAFFIFCAKRR